MCLPGLHSQGSAGPSFPSSASAPVPHSAPASAPGKGPLASGGGRGGPEGSAVAAEREVAQVCGVWVGGWGTQWHRWVYVWGGDD